MRDAYDSNVGAFGEMIRAFRPYLDLGAVKRHASRVRPPPGGAPLPLAEIGASE